MDATARPPRGAASDPCKRRGRPRDAKQRRCNEERGLDREDRGVGDQRRAANARARSTSTVPLRRRARRRWLAPRPRDPSACPRANPRPSPARPIIEPIAATANAPLETPSVKTAPRNASGPSDRSRRLRLLTSDSAEEAQPPIVHTRREPRIRPPIREARRPRPPCRQRRRHAACRRASWSTRATSRRRVQRKVRRAVPARYRRAWKRR